MLQHHLSTIYTPLDLHTSICISISNYRYWDPEFMPIPSIPIKYYRIHFGFSLFHVCNSFFDMRSLVPNMLNVFTHLSNFLCVTSFPHVFLLLSGGPDLKWKVRGIDGSDVSVSIFLPQPPSHTPVNTCLTPLALQTHSGIGCSHFLWSHLRAFRLNYLEKQDGCLYN